MVERLNIRFSGDLAFLEFPVERLAQDGEEFLVVCGFREMSDLIRFQLVVDRNQKCVDVGWQQVIVMARAVDPLNVQKIETTSEALFECVAFLTAEHLVFDLPLCPEIKEIQIHLKIEHRAGFF